MTTAQTTHRTTVLAPATETLVAALARTVDRHGGSPALRWQQDGAWHGMTWAEYGARAAAVAAGLRDLGVSRGDHVVLLLRNRPEFYWVDTACMLLGAVPVSVYLSPAVDRLAEAIDRCGAVACVAENGVFLSRVRAALAVTAARPRLIGVDPDTAAPDVVPLAGLYGSAPVDLTAAASTARLSDRVTMLYTSGTTASPKGVPLTHANLRFATETLGRRMGVSLTGRRQLSYLPMAHIGERLATHYLHLVQGSEVTCCPDLAAFPATLAATRPHMLFGAPRMWERLYQTVTARTGDRPDPDVVTAVLDDLGVGEIDVAIVGSAPLPPYVQRFWIDAGIPLADCYGQTESCGMGAWDPHHIVPGTCGKPFDGMELRLAEDGEVQVRGPAVFDGYHEDAEATARAFDGDGWYRSGDLGHLADDGNLVLDGRKNDVLVPTSGHNVNPTPLEAELRRIPGIGHAVVVGHGRPHLTAVLALDPETAPAWAAEAGIVAATLADVAADPRMRAAVEERVAALNEGLPGAERIRDFVIVPEVWQTDTAVLTPTGKLRRRGILDAYSAQIDALYERASHRPGG
jgi:long-chain acyl-CoA synthetase